MPWGCEVLHPPGTRAGGVPRVLRGEYTLAKGKGPWLAALGVHTLSAPYLGLPGHSGFRGCLGLSPLSEVGYLPKRGMLH